MHVSDQFSPVPVDYLPNYKSSKANFNKANFNRCQIKKQTAGRSQIISSSVFRFQLFSVKINMQRLESCCRQIIHHGEQVVCFYLCQIYDRFTYLKLMRSNTPQQPHLYQRKPWYWINTLFWQISWVEAQGGKILVTMQSLFLAMSLCSQISVIHLLSTMKWYI